MAKSLLFLGGLLVLTTSSAWAARYTDNGNGTITDTQTKMVWQQTADGVQRTWEDAITYCENLSLADKISWRLPNFRALQSLLDDTRVAPALDPLFLGAWEMEYWSSTTQEFDSTRVWALNFEQGSIWPGVKGSGYPYLYTRCVTGGYDLSQDGDQDHVPNSADLCPASPVGQAVDASGCP